MSMDAYYDQVIIPNITTWSKRLRSEKSMKLPVRDAYKKGMIDSLVAGGGDDIDNIARNHAKEIALRCFIDYIVFPYLMEHRRQDLNINCTPFQYESCIYHVHIPLDCIYIEQYKQESLKSLCYLYDILNHCPNIHYCSNEEGKTDSEVRQNMYRYFASKHSEKVFKKEIQILQGVTHIHLELTFMTGPIPNLPKFMIFASKSMYYCNKINLLNNKLHIKMLYNYLSGKNLPINKFINYAEEQMDLFICKLNETLPTVGEYKTKYTTPHQHYVHNSTRIMDVVCSALRATRSYKHQESKCTNERTPIDPMAAADFTKSSKYTTYKYTNTTTRSLYDYFINTRGSAVDHTYTKMCHNILTSEYIEEINRDIILSDSELDELRCINIHHNNNMKIYRQGSKVNTLQYVIELLILRFIRMPSGPTISQEDSLKYIAISNFFYDLAYPSTCDEYATTYRAVAKSYYMKGSYGAGSTTIKEGIKEILTKKVTDLDIEESDKRLIVKVQLSKFGKIVSSDGKGTMLEKDSAVRNWYNDIYMYTYMHCGIIYRGGYITELHNSIYKKAIRKDLSIRGPGANNTSMKVIASYISVQNTKQACFVNLVHSFDSRTLHRGTNTIFHCQRQQRLRLVSDDVINELTKTELDKFINSKLPGIVTIHDSFLVPVMDLNKMTLAYNLSLYNMYSGLHSMKTKMTAHLIYTCYGTISSAFNITSMYRLIPVNVLYFMKFGYDIYKARLVEVQKAYKHMFHSIVGEISEEVNKTIKEILNNIIVAALFLMYNNTGSREPVSFERYVQNDFAMHNAFMKSINILDIPTHLVMHAYYVHVQPKLSTLNQHFLYKACFVTNLHEVEKNLRNAQTSATNKPDKLIHSIEYLKVLTYDNEYQSQLICLCLIERRVNKMVKSKEYAENTQKMLGDTTNEYGNDKPTVDHNDKYIESTSTMLSEPVGNTLRIQGGTINKKKNDRPTVNYNDKYIECVCMMLCEHIESGNNIIETLENITNENTTDENTTNENTTDENTTNENTTNENTTNENITNENKKTTGSESSDLYVSILEDARLIDYLDLLTMHGKVLAKNNIVSAFLSTSLDQDSRSEFAVDYMFDIEHIDNMPPNSLTGA